MSFPGRRGLPAVAAVLAILGAAAARGQGLALDTTLLAQGLVAPVGIVAADDGSGRLFIVQQRGQILIWNGTAVQATPFLDLSGLVTACGETCGESGLLGLAFHPDYADNGLFFVNYTNATGATVIARYEVSADDPDLADTGSAEILLTIVQPAGNHNGGDLAFGPDGHLYVPTGDGGGGGDPQERAQDLGELLGKVLRLDVDSVPQGPLDYVVPADNPFVGQAGARGEIWAYGLRNPWRFSFDRDTGDLWLGDVGQGTWEEVDLQPAASPGGENYGWDCREGAHDFVEFPGDPGDHCAGLTGFVDPVLEYAHVTAGEPNKCSVTGGFRYRGDALPRLRGVYLFADLCSGEIFGSIPRCSGPRQARLLLDTAFNVTAFGEDEAGELYVTQYVAQDLTSSRVHGLTLAPGSGGPDLELSNGAIDFGTVEVGDTVRRELTLTNDNAGPEALTVHAALLTGSADLALDAGGSAPCTGPHPCLAPGESCTMVVELQGTAPGSVAADLDYEGNFEPEGVALAAQVVPCASAVDLEVTGLTVPAGGDETRRACDTLVAGPDVLVQAGGALTLRAGTRLVLRGGFRVAAGGELSLASF